ncbi:MAG: hypothetical protein JXA54_10410 [Candidatus Heimdallarchaeota archaeon]|nr:hypothetical protein [Candidatus Heimdallarchaeota archaeon]
MNGVEKREKRFKNIFNFYLKINKKRLIVTLIVSVIVFSLLTTFFLTWFNYRYNFFYSTEANYDWRRDNNISVIFSKGLEEKLQVSNSYFNLAVNEIYSAVNDIAPGMFNLYTASMYCQIDSIKYNPLETYSAGLYTLHQEAYNLLVDNLIEGRMPNNKTELVYRSSNPSDSNYLLEEQIGLEVVAYEECYVQNFTIVGILGNFSNSFYQEGYSNDIFKEVSYLHEGYDQFDFDLFFTSPTNFIQIMSFYPIDFIEKLTLNVDFDYHLTNENIRNLKRITNKLSEFQSNYQNYEYLPHKKPFFCLDLEEFIYNFQITWNYQTIKILASGIPAILLFSLLCIEIFNIGNFEKNAQFRLFKTLGVEFNVLQKTLLVENIIVTSFGLIIGVSLLILLIIFACQISLLKYLI